MDNLQLSYGGSMAFGSAGLANGTSAGTIRIVNVTPYTIDGVFASKAATDNIRPNCPPPRIPIVLPGASGSVIARLFGDGR